MSDPRVLIVGAGPVGLTAANLLGAAGLSAIVMERNSSTSDAPKAIGLDAESMRTMQAVGLHAEVARIVVPGTGTRYYGRKGQLLVHSRGPRPFIYGHPFKNSFAQPDLEKLLLRGAQRFKSIDVQFDTTVEGVEIVPEGGALVTYTRTGKLARRQQRFDYVIACDGGSSDVRKSLGIPMTGQSHSDVWMVVDVLGDTHPERYSMHMGIPTRPVVIVPGLRDRCRYEFLLKPGEGESGEVPPFELIERLVGQYRPISADQVERAVNYHFNSLVAEIWRKGDVFLAGDAAHMMAPFGGQGLNSGIRDVVNLAWKLIAVVKGQADASVLDTYQLERRKHACDVVTYSRRLGAVMMHFSKPKALLRDAVVKTLVLVPSVKRYLTEMRFRPPQILASGLVFPVGAGKRPRLLGAIMTQPNVLPPDTLLPTRLDAHIGAGWKVLGVDVSRDDWQLIPSEPWPWSDVVRHDVVLQDRAPWQPGLINAFADSDGDLQRDLEPYRGKFILLRPDRVVSAVFTAVDVPSVVAGLARYSATGASFNPMSEMSEGVRAYEGREHHRRRRQARSTTGWRRVRSAPV